MSAITRSEKAEKWNTTDTKELCLAILNLQNMTEAKKFLRDLLTANEIIEFGQRWKVAKMLAAGVPYREIGRRTWMTSRTVARIQKWLKGGKGGYRLIINRLAHHPISSGKRSGVV